MLEDLGAANSFLFCIRAWLSHARMPSATAAFDSSLNTYQAHYDHVDKCSSLGRENHTVVADLDGTITRSRSSFPYFMLVAYEAGSPLRALLLLLVSPIVWFLYHFVSEASGIQLLIFVAFAGLKASDISGVARAVLCKFYLEDMHSGTYKVFTACKKRYVVTANPTIMVEPFLNYYLGVEHVMGTEVQTIGGYCTGCVSGPGVLVGMNKKNAVKELFREKSPDVGIGDRPTDYPFMSLCKEAYIVPPKHVDTVPRKDYLKPLIFHDGRLAIRPTPLVSVFIFLWLPFGFILAVIRVFIGITLPIEFAVPLSSFLGVRIRIKGSSPPSSNKSSTDNRGMLYVCSHRTLLDPIFLSGALGRKVTAVTYSLSKISEFLSPIKTVCLTRCRVQDAKTIQALLREGDLVICPEGTTCREPYLLRFSSLFAELTNDIVPVIMVVRMDLFHGNTARGFKGMDPFYFLMNPFPRYTVTLLSPLPEDQTCAGGKSSIEVANYLQKQMADAMGFQCTTYTRKDKYRILAGNDGVVPDTVQKIHINNVFL